MVLKRKEPLKGIQSTYYSKNNKSPFFTSGYPIMDKHSNITAVVTHAQYLPEIIESTTQLEEAQALLKRYSEEIRKIQYDTLQINEQKHFIAKSISYVSLLEKIDKIASTITTVLLTGETGVGKSFLANRIHQLSNRHEGPFVEINCGAIPESLIESELFGYEKAAFTGASASGKAGLIKMANGGTLFLDEIGELPLHLQVKFLHFLQEKTFLPIGATQQQTADVRIIAATNRNLLEEVQAGAFRSDLYYRLNVLPLKVPSLKERREDIIGLLQFNLDKYNKLHNKACEFAPDALETLRQYDWPGNIRELENLVERLVLINPHDEITIHDLPSQINNDQIKQTNFKTYQEGASLTSYVEDIEKDIIINALKKHKTTRKAAESLMITQSLLMRRIQKYKIVL